MDFAQINLKLPKELKEQIDDLANKSGFSTTVMIRLMLEKYFEEGD